MGEVQAVEVNRNHAKNKDSIDQAVQGAEDDTDIHSHNLERIGYAANYHEDGEVYGICKRTAGQAGSVHSRPV